jgi:hypothetical protein
MATVQYTSEQLEEVQMWLETARPAVGQVLPEWPWRRNRHQSRYRRALEDLLAGRDLAARAVRGMDDFVVLPPEKADPLCWAIVNDLDEATNYPAILAAAAALLDRLRDQHGTEPCARLRAWQIAWRRHVGQEDARELAARAEDWFLRRLPPQQQSRLQELAREIAAGQGAILTAARATLGHVRAVGELLREAKQLVGHGNFRQWLEEHAPFSVRTARDYLRVATRWAEIQEAAKRQCSAVFSIQEALALLRPSGEGPDDLNEHYDPFRSTPQILEAVPAVIECLSKEEDGSPVVREADELKNARARLCEEDDALARQEERANAEVDAAEQKWSEQKREFTDRCNRVQSARREREQRFDLEAAIGLLREDLELLRRRWPASRRHEFVRVARSVLDALAAETESA